MYVGTVSGTHSLWMATCFDSVNNVLFQYWESKIKIIFCYKIIQSILVIQFFFSNLLLMDQNKLNIIDRKKRMNLGKPFTSNFTIIIESIINDKYNNESKNHWKIESNKILFCITYIILRWHLEHLLSSFGWDSRTSIGCVHIDIVRWIVFI